MSLLSESFGFVEVRGIERVEESERGGKALDLLWVWCAANIGVLGVTLGAELVTFRGLNLWQSLLVALVGGAGSFALVGMLSVAGKWGGAPQLILSRAVFGIRGNGGPVVISWMTLVGWEAVMSIIAAYAFRALLWRAFHLPIGPVTTIVSLATVVLLAVVVGLLGHTTIMRVQKWAAYLLGVFTIVLVVRLCLDIDWQAATQARGGPTSAVLAGIGFIAAGTGLGWINTGADYARYLPGRESGRSITGWVTLGAGLPLVALIGLGALSAVKDPDLASANDPVAAIGAALPSWMAVPYLVLAVGGLVTATVLSLYSSGLNLLAVGLPIKRTAAIGLDAVLVIGCGVYVMVIADDFYGPFVAFLTLLALAMFPWGTIFGLDMLLRRGYDVDSLFNETPQSRYWFTRGFSVPALGAWAAGIVVGLLFTSAAVDAQTVWFQGPWAQSWVGRNNLGWIAGGLVSGIIYVLLERWNVPVEPVPA